MRTIIVVLSGGLDSTALLYRLRHGFGVEAVRAVSFNYGQRHAKELIAAQAVAQHAGVPHEIIHVPALGAMGGSSQTDAAVAVPEGHYTDETMRATVVPNRNMVFLALATAYAVAHKAQAVAYGAHAGDHAIYPDCRREFADAMGEAMRLCDYEPITLMRPFVELTKAQVVTEGVAYGAPLELTWSCYKGDEKHCGRCGTCVERIEAFQLAGVSDPTEYATT